MGWYLWIKALHVVGIIAWMAALLYLPRLYVYHADAAPGSELSETFKVMERRLLRAIAMPAMLVSLGAGLAMLVMVPGLWHESWMQVKMAGVIGLLAVHGLLARWLRDFAADCNRHSARFYRILNEVPTLLMLLIVVMVVLRPWG